MQYALSVLFLLFSSTLSALDSHDPVWEVPPKRWLDGIPLANGDMGAMIWGDGSPLKITLDKYDAWETRDQMHPGITYRELRQLVEEKKREEVELALQHDRIYKDKPYPTRLPMPRLEIDFNDPFSWDSARLKLQTATAELMGSVADSALKITVYVHANTNVLEICLQGKKAKEARFHLSHPCREKLLSWGYPAAEVQESEDSGSLVQKTPSAYSYAVHWKRVIVSDVEVHAYISMDQAEISDLESHESWWRAFWQRSWLSIPDARLEALYSIEMYKLGSSSRPGKLPITLQGLWTLDGDMPPWSGDYHLDMNLEQSYWPIYTANRLELGEPLYRTINACIPRWQEQARQFFGFEGIWSGCAIGPAGERVYGYSGVEFWPGNSAWLAHHYYLHFLYSQDRAFLQDQALPIIRLSLMTYANLLEKEADGKLHLPFSHSPEWGEGSMEAFMRDPTCDLALIRFLAQALITSHELLETDEPMLEQAKDILAHLADYPQGPNGLNVSADVPLLHSHRHHSHLMGIYPLGVISDQELIRRSLYQIRKRGTGEWTGWSFPWMSLIASRSNQGNMAWQMLDIYARSFIAPNTLHINGDPRHFGLSRFDYEPMTLEAGFGAAAAIMEMLLQSHDGTIRVFPSMPDFWHDAVFARLRAVGAFVITSVMKAGVVQYVLIESEQGLPCRLLNPFKCDAEMEGHALSELSGDFFEFPTEKGGRYLLYPKGKRPKADVDYPTPLSHLTSEDHYFGMKRLKRL